MNKKPLLLLIGLGVVLVVGAWLVSRKQSATYRHTTREGAKLLTDFDPNAVATLHIRSGSNAVTLARQAEVWVVRERGDYPADFNAIRELLRKFWDLKVSRPVQAGASRLPLLGLAGADAESTLVEMKAADGQLVQSVLLGTNSLNESRGWPTGRYVMLGDDLQRISLVADSLAEVEPAPQRWLNKEFFKVEKLKAVAVQTPAATNNWKFSRESETAEWKLADAKPEENVDATKTSGLNNLLSYPSFNDVVPGAAVLEQPVVATLETFEGFTYTVKCAKQTEDTYHLQVAVSAAFTKARQPGADEKPEDKERLDKEFQANRERLEQKRKTEQACEKWTYLVSKWTVDQLLKVRGDFLAAKPAEPAATPSADATPDSPAK